MQSLRLLMTVLSTLTTAVLLGVVGSNAAIAANPDVPSGMPVSPLFGATDFSQQMLRFEEFDRDPLPDPRPTVVKTLPLPVATTAHPDPCQSAPDGALLDAFLEEPLYPAPSRQANDADPNPWASLIATCIPSLPAGFTGVLEGRPPGESFAHQRWDEFPPQVSFQSAMGQARPGTGRNDHGQRHQYSLGEFGPGGLYHNTVGGGLTQFEGTTAGIPIKLHPSMPEQDPLSLWTFGGGTLPPKLLTARYGEPVLFRHYNALPIDVAANAGPGTLGFGEHTITTHEHNGHQPGESDGFAGAYFFPGEYYDYRWPMQLAGYDSINTDASDPRAATPCAPEEVMMISNPLTHVPEAKVCDPVTQTIKIPGDWHETMSTHWFHDHMIDRTSENVYKGNAAMMNYYSAIDRGKEGFRCNYSDPANVNLCLPSGTALGWGNRDYDVQLLLADKAWAPVTGQLAMGDVELFNEGFTGDRMTVNWLYKPYFDVRARRYRFRMLDGAVARFFKVAIVREFNDATSGEFPGPAGSNKSYSRINYHLVANDGNIMEHAIPFPNAQSNDLPMMCIAERLDVIIDFSQFPVGTKLYMVNTVWTGSGRGPEKIIPLGDILSGAYNPVPDLTAGCTDRCWKDDPTVGKFLEFRVQPYSGTDLSMNPADYEIGKKTMIPLVKPSDAELAAAVHRTFEFGRGGTQASDGRPTPWTIKVDGNLALNANLNRVSAAPETIGGGWEIWHIKSGGGWGHPVHVHFEESHYLQRSDGPGTERTPPLWEQGARKDMYRVSNLGEGPLGIPDSSLEIVAAVRFREFAGTFVEHCHNTTHEDKAMLLRWDNELPGQTQRIPTPIPTWEGVTYVSPATPYTSIPAGDPGGASQTAVIEEPTLKTGTVVPGFTAPHRVFGDLNWDTFVNLTDYSLFRSRFGSSSILPWAADLDESGAVNLTDYSLFRQNFGQSTGLPLPNNNPLP